MAADYEVDGVSVHVADANIGELRSRLDGTVVEVWWVGDSTLYEPQNYELYCHACHTTISSQALAPARFDIRRLHSFDHPGPYTISLLVVEKPSTEWYRIYARTRVEGDGMATFDDGWSMIYYSPTRPPLTMPERGQGGNRFWVSPYTLTATPAAGNVIKRWDVASVDGDESTNRRAYARAYTGTQGETWNHQYAYSPEVTPLVWAYADSIPADRIIRVEFHVIFAPAKNVLIYTDGSSGTLHYIPESIEHHGTVADYVGDKGLSFSGF